MPRQVKMLVDPDPEFVSIVDRPAAKKTFRIIKRDGRQEAAVKTSGGGEGGDVRSSALASARARLGVLKTIIKALGGGDDTADSVLAEDVRALVFDKQAYTRKQAESWALQRGFKATWADETDEVIRLVGEIPNDTEEFEVVELGEGVSALLERERARTLKDRSSVEVGLPMTDSSKNETSGGSALSQSFSKLRGFNPFKVRTDEGAFSLSNPPFRATDTVGRLGGSVTKKTMGAGGIGQTDFSNAMGGMNESPNVLDLFAVMQGVMFNVLNDTTIGDKREKMAGELGKFQNALLDSIESLPLAKVQEQQVQAELLGRVRQAGVEKLATVVDAVVDLAAGGEVEEVDMDTAKFEAMIESIGKKIDSIDSRLGAIEGGKKSNGETPADEEAPDTDKQPGETPADTPVEQAISKMGERITSRLDQMDERVAKMERTTLRRQGTAEVRKTMEDDRPGGTFNNLFPWGRTGS
jgi:hypothetical protein